MEKREICRDRKRTEGERGGAGGGGRRRRGVEGVDAMGAEVRATHNRGILMHLIGVVCMPVRGWGGGGLSRSKEDGEGDGRGEVGRTGGEKGDRKMEDERGR